MKIVSILAVTMIGVVCLFGTGTAAEQPPKVLPAVVEDANQVVPLDLQVLVRKVVERNTSVITDYLQSEMARANVEMEKGIYEPIFHTSANWYTEEYPNTTEDVLIRQEEDYSEDAFMADAGVKGLLSSGASWDLTFIDKKRTSSTIEKFRNYRYEYGNSVKLSLEQPLLRGFGKTVTNARIDLARIDSEIERKKFDQKLMELIGATIRQYWLLYGTQEIHRTWKQSLQIAESFLEDVERRAREGKIPETDLMEARCSIGLRRAEVYNAENRLIEAQSQLMTLLYVSSSGCMRVQLAADQTGVDRRSIVDPVEYVQMALDNWPEYLIAKKRIERENIGVLYAENQLLPQIDLAGNAALNGLDKDRDPALDETFDANYVSWFIGVNVQLPVFGNRSAKSDLLIARMRARQAAVELDGLKTGIGNAITDRVERVNRFDGQVDEYEKVWDFRQKLLEVERTKLRYGRISLNELLEKEEDCVDYQRQLLNSIVNFKLAEAELDIAIGKILTKYGITPEEIKEWTSGRPESASCENLKQWFDGVDADRQL